MGFFSRCQTGGQAIYRSVVFLLDGRPTDLSGRAMPPGGFPAGDETRRRPDRGRRGYPSDQHKCRKLGAGRMPGVRGQPCAVLWRQGIRHSHPGRPACPKCKRQLGHGFVIAPCPQSLDQWLEGPRPFGPIERAGENVSINVINSSMLAERTAQSFGSHKARASRPRRCEASRPRPLSPCHCSCWFLRHCRVGSNWRRRDSSRGRVRA